MDKGGDIELGGRLQHRVAHIAAGADHRVRLKLPDYLSGLPGGEKDVFQRLQVMAYILQAAAAAEVRDLNGKNFKALPGNQLHFHFALSADEKDTAVRQKLPEPARKGESGVYMAGSAAAGEDEFHGCHSFLSVIMSLEALRIIPISPS